MRLHGDLVLLYALPFGQLIANINVVFPTV